MAVCSICGSQEFKEGYGGRLSPTGFKPTCVSCGSVERHRIIHSMYKALTPITQKIKALQFAPDITVSAANFATLDGSTYNGPNSMDMMRTGLPDGSYDLIISNHVLEHVSDDMKAIREMIRVVGPKGVVHICVPSPAQNLRTRDWGFADPARAYHFRWYGADSGQFFAKAVQNLHVMAVVGRDPATDTYDMVFWLSMNNETLDFYGRALLASSFAVLLLS